MEPPLPEPPPRPPDAGDHPTGEHLALSTEVRRWGIIPAVVAGLSAVLGTGGIIAFMIGWSSDVEAKARTAAKEEAQIVSQRFDVLKGDVEVVKIQVATVDAGVSKDIRRLEQKIDDNAKEQRAMSAEILRRLPK